MYNIQTFYKIVVQRLRYQEIKTPDSPVFTITCGFFSRHNKQQIASVTDFIILAKSEKPKKELEWHEGHVMGWDVAIVACRPFMSRKLRCPNRLPDLHTNLFAPPVPPTLGAPLVRRPSARLPCLYGLLGC